MGYGLWVKKELLIVVVGTGSGQQENVGSIGLKIKPIKLIEQGS